MPENDSTTGEVPAWCPPWYAPKDPEHAFARWVGELVRRMREADAAEAADGKGEVA